MKVRATLRLRNDGMLAAREKLGLTQKALAELAGVGIADVGMFESFRYGDIGDGSAANERSKRQKAQRLADVLEIPVAAVMQDGDEDVTVDSTRVAVAEIELARLPAPQSMLMLSPPDAAEKSEIAELIEAQLAGLQASHPRDCLALVLRYGLNGQRPHTLDEAAAALGVSRERVRQMEAHAVRLLQHPARTRKIADAMGLPQ